MRRIALFVAAFLLAPALAAGAADREVFLVKPDGTGDFPTIQAAISALDDGAIIELADGTFRGEGNRDLYPECRDLSIRSQSMNPQLCIIDCEGSQEDPHWAFAFSCGGGLPRWPFTLEGITFRGGYGYAGGALLSYDGCCYECVNCIFTENTAEQMGGAVYVGWGSPNFTDCLFYNNYSGDKGGALYFVEYCNSIIKGCTIVDNHAEGGGGGIFAYFNSQIYLENTIIADSFSGEGILCEWDSGAALHCCDIYGNAGGDYVGCLEGQEGINGNIHEDPLFCNYLNQDYRLSEESPCAPLTEPNTECPLIGSEPVGCGSIVLTYPNGGELFYVGDHATIRWDIYDSHGLFIKVELLHNDEVCAEIYNAVGNDGEIGWVVFQCGPWESGYKIRLTDLLFNYSEESDMPFNIMPEFGISSIEDIGNDQGRQVRLTWRRSPFDGPEQPVINGYEIYRRQDEYKTAETNQRVEGWDYIATVPAHGDDIYQAVAPTLCDSTEQGGICWSAFFLRAVTPDPRIFFETAADSGYSIDNLAPSAPANFRFLSSSVLGWDEAPEADFDYFTIYGSESGYLGPDAVVIGYTTGTTMDVSDHSFNYYHVTASDFAGNEGEESTVTTSGVGAMEAGRSLILYQNYPNPSFNATTLSFYLPAETDVKLDLFDIAGRAVLTFVNGRMGPGLHNIRWAGILPSGESAPMGVYFYRLTAGGSIQTKKLIMSR
ncbi:MAG: T9SS type A sorting domain-containing protein [Candidatus Eisenbacteria bacterium]|nr:T9SS type A sorting domain-containing protein [Candidatus Eisenbacteria bacterium]